MKGKPLGDAEYTLLIEEEKRLCTPAEYIKATFQPGISLRDKEVVDSESTVPGIKITKIENKSELLKTDSESQWKLYQDNIEGKLVLFLEIGFPKLKRPAYHFCFELNMKLKKLNQRAIIKTPQGSFICDVLEADEKTSEILEWLKALIKSRGEITLVDNSEPSVGVDGIRIDIPEVILQMYGWIKDE